MLLDSGDMKMEHVRTMMKLIETIVNIIKVETKKLKINKKDKKCQSTQKQFPSIVELSEEENDYLNLDHKMIFTGASLLHTIYFRTMIGHEDS